MNCFSDGCTRPAYAKWQTEGEPGATPTRVLAWFLLCQPHDEWYQTETQQWGYRAARIGPIREGEVVFRD